MAIQDRWISFRIVFAVRRSGLHRLFAARPTPLTSAMLRLTCEGSVKYRSKFDKITGADDFYADPPSGQLEMTNYPRESQ
jgi:hypothetical protein